MIKRKDSILNKCNNVVEKSSSMGRLSLSFFNHFVEAMENRRDKDTLLRRSFRWKGF